jgi:hypothetical protein
MRQTKSKRGLPFRAMFSSVTKTKRGIRLKLNDNYAVALFIRVILPYSLSPAVRREMEKLEKQYLSKAKHETQS